MEAQVARVRLQANTALMVWLTIWSAVMVVLSSQN